MPNKKFLTNELSAYSIGVFVCSFCIGVFFVIQETPSYLIDNYGFNIWLGRAVGSFIIAWLFPLGIGIVVGTIIWFTGKKVFDFGRTIPYFSYVATIHAIVFGWLIG